MVIEEVTIGNEQAILVSPSTIRSPEMLAYVNKHGQPHQHGHCTWLKLTESTWARRPFSGPVAVAGPYHKRWGGRAKVKFSGGRVADVEEVKLAAGDGELE